MVEALYSILLIDSGMINDDGMLDPVKLKTEGRIIISLRWMVWGWPGPALVADPSEFIIMNSHGFLRSV